MADSIKERLSKAFPLFSRLFAVGRPTLVKQFLLTTTGAGNKTITGIRKKDELVSVLDLTNIVDYTSEFSIIADDTIDNTGGTALGASTKILVTYLSWTDPR